MNNRVRLVRTVAAAATAFVMGFGSPALAMESPERVYAHHSCDGDRWMSPPGRFASFDECFDYYVEQYQATCPWDEEHRQCYR